MEHAVSEPDDLHMGAAQLAFELLLFEHGAAHPGRAYVPEGQPRVGEAAYVFLPSARRIATADVPAFLAGLPSPALISATTSRGVSALLLLDELAGARRVGFEKALANQTAAVEQLASRLKLTDESAVAVEFDDRSRTFPLAALREWARSFVCTVGWNLDRPLDRRHADARLLLIRSDGGLTKGGLRPPSED